MSDLRSCQVPAEALLILFKVTGICAVTTLSIVHPSLDVHTRSIIIHIISLINPLLMKKKQLIQGGIEVYEGKVMLLQETDTAGIIYCLWIDANHDYSCVKQPQLRGDYGGLRAQVMTM